MVLPKRRRGKRPDARREGPHKNPSNRMKIWRPKQGRPGEKPNSGGKKQLKKFGGNHREEKREENKTVR